MEKLLKWMQDRKQEKKDSGRWAAEMWRWPKIMVPILGKLPLKESHTGNGAVKTEPQAGMCENYNRKPPKQKS